MQPNEAETPSILSLVQEVVAILLQVVAMHRHPDFQASISYPQKPSSYHYPFHQDLLAHVIVGVTEFLHVNNATIFKLNRDLKILVRVQQVPFPVFYFPPYLASPTCPGPRRKPLTPLCWCNNPNIIPYKIQ